MVTRDVKVVAPSAVLGRVYLMLNLSAARDNHGLPQRLDHVWRQMLCDTTPCHKRCSATWKIEHDVSECEDGSQRIPQPLVSAWPVNSEPPHHARLGGVHREANVARIRLIVAELPEVRLSLGEVCAKSDAHTLARNTFELAVLKTLHIDIEAHGVV